MDIWQEYRDSMIATIQAEMRSTAAQTGVARLSPKLRRTLSEIPRHRFVPAWLRHTAYADMALSIGFGQTISQPFIVAMMTELLDLRGDERVLEIGTGCGYQTAILASLCTEPGAALDSVECIAGLAATAEHHLQTLDLMHRVRLHTGNGWEGWKVRAPYDAILVTAAAARIPEPLIAQLAPGGRMVIPVGPEGCVQQLLCVEKSDHGEIQTREVLAVVFVPLMAHP